MALQALAPEQMASWTVCAPREVLSPQGGPTTGGLSTGALPPELRVSEEPDLQLSVPLRSFRSPALADWVLHVLDGDDQMALSTTRDMESYPIVLSRTLQATKKWLLANARA